MAIAIDPPVTTAFASHRLRGEARQANPIAAEKKGGRVPSLQHSVWLKVNPSRPHASQKFFRRQRGGPTWIAATLAVAPRAANAITEITLIAAGAANFSSAAFFGTHPAHSPAL